MSSTPWDLLYEEGISLIQDEAFDEGLALLDKVSSSRSFSLRLLSFSNADIVPLCNYSGLLDFEAPSFRRSLLELSFFKDSRTSSDPSLIAMSEGC